MTDSQISSSEKCNPAALQIEDKAPSSNRNNTGELCSRNALYICIGVVGLMVPLVCILVPLSFSGVEYYEYAFKRQRSTGQVDTTGVYDGGKLYLMGPDYDFKKYQASAHFVTLDNLTIFTSDKLEIIIDVYFQYFLRKEELHILQETYDISYKDAIKENATDALKSEAIKYMARQFITNRADVEETLFKVVRERLGGLCCQKNCTIWKYACPDNCINVTKCNDKEDKGFWVNVIYFQLGGVTVDSSLANRYLYTSMLPVSHETELLKQKVQTIRKQTNETVREIENNAREALRAVKLQSQQIIDASQARCTRTIEKARRETLESVNKRFGFDAE